jgi:hypothetical protein
MRKFARLGAATAAATGLTIWGLAACSSSPATTTGTETMSGTVTGMAAVGSSTTGPAIPITMTGPVTATSVFDTPGGNGTKATITFKTDKGNLVVDANAPDANAQPAVNSSTCYFSQVVHATYTVVGGKSTGAFKGATGSGNAAVTFHAYDPKLTNGKCNESNSAQPLANGALSSFTASGPLTVQNG